MHRVHYFGRLIREPPVQCGAVHSRVEGFESDKEASEQVVVVVESGKKEVPLVVLDQLVEDYRPQQRYKEEVRPLSSPFSNKIVNGEIEHVLLLYSTDLILPNRLYFQRYHSTVRSGTELHTIS